MPARPEHPTTTATGDGAWLLTGEKTYVLGRHRGPALLHPGPVTSGLSVFAVERDAPASRSPRLTPSTRPAAGHAHLADTPARLIGALGAGLTALRTVSTSRRSVLIAEQAGGAMHAMQMSADYARTRFQFARAIGSSQAIKHMCVDMPLEAQSAVSGRSSADRRPFDAQEPDCLTDLALAQAYWVHGETAAIDVSRYTAASASTWEHPAHLYRGRARTDAQIFGDPAFHPWERYVRLPEKAA